MRKKIFKNSIYFPCVTTQKPFIFILFVFSFNMQQQASN